MEHVPPMSRGTPGEKMSELPAAIHQVAVKRVGIGR